MSGVEVVITLAGPDPTPAVVTSAFRSAATLRIGPDGAVCDVDLYDVPSAVARAVGSRIQGHDAGPAHVEPGRPVLDLDGGWLWLPLCRHPYGTPVHGVADVVAHHTIDRLVDLRVRIPAPRAARPSDTSLGSQGCPNLLPTPTS